MEWLGDTIAALNENSAKLKLKKSEIASFKPCLESFRATVLEFIYDYDVQGSSDDEGEPTDSPIVRPHDDTSSAGPSVAALDTSLKIDVRVDKASSTGIVTIKSPKPDEHKKALDMIHGYLRAFTVESHPFDVSDPSKAQEAKKLFKSLKKRKIIHFFSWVKTEKKVTFAGSPEEVANAKFELENWQTSRRQVDRYIMAPTNSLVRFLQVVEDFKVKLDQVFDAIKNETGTISVTVQFQHGTDVVGRVFGFGTEEDEDFVVKEAESALESFLTSNDLGGDMIRLRSEEEVDFLLEDTSIEKEAIGSNVWIGKEEVRANSSGRQQITKLKTVVNPKKGKKAKKSFGYGSRTSAKVTKFTCATDVFNKMFGATTVEVVAGPFNSVPVCDTVVLKVNSMYHHENHPTTQSVFDTAGRNDIKSECDARLELDGPLEEGTHFLTPPQRLGKKGWKYITLWSLPQYDVDYPDSSQSLLEKLVHSVLDDAVGKAGEGAGASLAIEALAGKTSNLNWPSNVLACTLCQAIVDWKQQQASPGFLQRIVFFTPILKVAEEYAAVLDDLHASHCSADEQEVDAVYVPGIRIFGSKEGRGIVEARVRKILAERTTSEIVRIDSLRSHEEEAEELNDRFKEEGIAADAISCEGGILVRAISTGGIARATSIAREYVQEVEAEMTEFPSTWTPGEWMAEDSEKEEDESEEDTGSHFEIVPVGIDSDEWKEVVELFEAGLDSPAKVVNVERVQHPGLWRRYGEKRLSIAKEGGENHVERLFFSNPRTNPLRYVEGDGIEPAWGEDSIVFSARSSYACSLSYSYNLDTSCVILADVCVGRVEKRDIDAYPVRPQGGFHSVYGKLYGTSSEEQSAPLGYAIFDCAQSYPSYIIHFENEKEEE
uniref:Uncharacterized protein n=1 Tax=Palpitomonas bilix TaxID=652834 RepID=A0A7S3GL54_9EUKA